MADSGDRTEKATGRKRQKSRDQGQFPYSQELTSALTLGACATVLFFYLKTPEGFRIFFATILNDVTTADNPELIMAAIIRKCGIYFLILTGPVFVTAVLAGLTGSVLQGLP